MTTPTVAAEDGGSEIWGHTISDLQSDITVADNAITGTLKYVDSGTLAHDWGAGYFIALAFSSSNDEIDTIKVGLKPSVSSGLVELDSDMNGIFKITNKNQQKFVVESHLTDGSVYTELYDLSGLTLASS